MIDPATIPDSGAAFPGMTLADAARALLERQKEEWALCRKGYATLSTVRSRTFDFDGFIIKAQFNPGRLTSSAAKVDEKSIRERPCFLCAKNLPPDQRGFRVEGEYLFLCNPFPIFPEHFTIPHLDHRPQRIIPSLTSFLTLARDLSPGYLVAYNGPRCGASAPDHMHLQAGVRGFIPFERELSELGPTRQETLRARGDLSVFSLSRYLRSLIVLQSGSRSMLEGGFQDIYETCAEVLQEVDEEPMMNLLSWHEDGVWTLAMFARSKHRPSFFYEEGERKILLSPAAVDMGGVCTLPLEQDLHKISREQVMQIFTEISLDEEVFRRLKSEITRRMGR